MTTQAKKQDWYEDYVQSKALYIITKSPQKNPEMDPTSQPFSKPDSTTTQLWNAPEVAPQQPLPIAEGASTLTSSVEEGFCVPTTPVTHQIYQPKHNMNPLSIMCKVINPVNNLSQIICVISYNCSSVTLLRWDVAEKWDWEPSLCAFF